jgi:hypothetical protein
VLIAHALHDIIKFFELRQEYFMNGVGLSGDFDEVLDFIDTN